MKPVRTTDDKLKELGFVKKEESQHGVFYTKNMNTYIHEVAILHKDSGDIIFQSYDLTLFDEKLIGNTCVGLKYEELKLFIKKIEEFKHYLEVEHV